MIENPVGIDAPIQELQQLFIDELWTHLDSSKKEFNHRVFKNQKKDRVIPEVFTEKGNSIIKGAYEEVVFNKRLDVLSWFDVPNTDDSFDGGQFSATVGIFFAVNLNAIYPDLSHRAVEEVHRDVLNLLDKAQVLGVIRNEDAYGDYSTEGLKNYNMQPWHVFRINYKMDYIINC